MHSFWKKFINFEKNHQYLKNVYELKINLKFGKKFTHFLEKQNWKKFAHCKRKGKIKNEQKSKTKKVRWHQYMSRGYFAGTIHGRACCERHTAALSSLQEYMETPVQRLISSLALTRPRLCAGPKRKASARSSGVVCLKLDHYDRIWPVLVDR